MIEKIKAIRGWAADNDIWYLKIDIDIPQAMADEAKAIHDMGYFIEHRDFDGWSTAPIHTWTDEEGVPPLTNTKGPKYPRSVRWGWTEIADYAPETVRWLKEFPHKQYARCRFMGLAPGAIIPPHHDEFDKNIFEAVNLGLTQPDGCVFKRLDKPDVLPFEPLSAFWFDNSVYHTVENNSDEHRLHFIIHGYDKFLSLAEKSLKKEYGNNILNEIYSNKKQYNFSRRDELNEYMYKSQNLSWKDWNDFKTDIKKYIVRQNGRKPYYSNAKVALIVMNPNEWKATWSKTLESQTNMTFYHLWAISEFGENRNFNVYLMDENTITDKLKNLKEKYAFICESGMVFNIKYWRDKLINEDVEVCKSHIMAQEENKAWNHPMNIWLNLKSNFKIDDLFKPYEFENRSEENHHSDYTPFWVDAHGTRIHNFTSEERDKKAWSYHKPRSSKYDEIVWSNVSVLYRARNKIRNRGRFFYFNNEDYMREWRTRFDKCGPYDVMLFPTSGLNAERFCMESKYKGKLIIYDHTPMHLQIKKDVHSLNPGIEGYKILQKYYSAKGIEGPFDVKDYPEWGNDAIDWVNNNCEIEYRLMDLMTTDYDELAEELKDKKVLFHHSNIFTYDLVSINYTFKKIRQTEENMRSKLIKATDQIFFSGESAYNLGSWNETKAWTNTA